MVRFVGGLRILYGVLFVLAQKDLNASNVLPSEKETLSLIDSDSPTIERPSVSYLLIHAIIISSAVSLTDIASPSIASRTCSPMFPEYSTFTELPLPRSTTA